MGANTTSFIDNGLRSRTAYYYTVCALNAAGARASFVEIDSDKGHDAFLLDEPVLRDALGGFMESAAQSRGLWARTPA